jgi:hypothetical protein
MYKLQIKWGNNNNNKLAQNTAVSLFDSAKAAEIIFRAYGK